MLSGVEASEVTLSFTRPAEAGASQKECTVLRTCSPEIDRQVATLQQLQVLVRTNEDPVYWRSAGTPDGKAFAELVSSIKDLKVQTEVAMFSRREGMMSLTPHLNCKLQRDAVRFADQCAFINPHSPSKANSDGSC